MPTASYGLSQFPSVRAFAMAGAKYSGRGVLNPSDEELATVALNLLTRKQKHDMFAKS